jgi:hypothetical protein
MRDGVTPVVVPQLRCQENPRILLRICPYRKPTQVGELKMLRRASETWLRN